MNAHTSAQRGLCAVLLALVLAITSAALVPEPANADPGRRHPATARPAVESVKPAKGSVLGGTKILIKGTNFTRVKKVLVGGAEATRVKVLSPTRIRATTPAGFAGKASIQVITRGGKSKKAKKGAFRYVDPAPVDTSRLTPAPGTFTATRILWVTGGPDPEAELGTPVAPWLVGLPADVASPSVGTPFFVPVGTPQFPSGLVGQVADVSTQAGGTSAVTVTPAPASSALSSVAVHFSGPVGAPASRVAAGGNVRDVTPAGMSFPKLGPNSFLCQNQANGQAASFSGSLGIRLENTRTDFDLDAGAPPFAAPYLSAWVRTEVVISGKVTANATIKCGLSPAWKNTHKLLVPIGAATLSLAPDASFSITGSGTVEFSNRTRRMFGITIFHNRPDIIDRYLNLGTDITGGSLSVSADAFGGIAAQFGALDRVGLEAKAGLAAQIKVTAKARPRQACVAASLGLKISINGFLDAWVAHWTTPGYAHTWRFLNYDKCTDPTDDAVADGLPAITTFRVPAATTGAAYSAQLATADGRAGTWAVVGGRLPQGLALDPATGEVYGTPSGTVGDYAFVVRFIDPQGRYDVQTVRLFLNPEQPVGGGVLQATLVWGSYADLDLHLVDPSNEEIYYAHRESASGGVLDRDANAGCEEQISNPIENIYWPAGEVAPPGQYTVFPVNYSSCSQTDLNWRLVVRLNGRVIIDQTGFGSTSGYTFTVGSGAAAARRSVREVPAPVAASAPKG